MGCRASVEAELQAVPGIRIVNVDVRRQTAAVIFDPTETNLDALRGAILRAGYEPKDETVVAGEQRAES